MHDFFLSMEKMYIFNSKIKNKMLYNDTFPLECWGSSSASSGYIKKIHLFEDSKLFIYNNQNSLPTTLRPRPAR